MDKVVTKKDYEVHLYEIDYNKKVTITSIMQYFEDIATYQSDELGIGIDYLMKNKIAWVLYKWDIHMDKYPEYGDKITVATIPYSIKKFYAYRRYEIYNKGEKVGEANSLWFLIDTEKRRPCKVSEDIFMRYGLTKEDDKQLEFEKLRSPENIDFNKRFNVRFSDIDTNRHVNNVKYVSWALENVPFEIMTKHKISDIRVVYEKEVTYGEAVTVDTEMKEEEEKYSFNHVIKNSKGERLTLIKTILSRS